MVRFEAAEDHLWFDLTNELLKDVEDVRIDDKAALEAQLRAWGIGLDAFQAP